MRFCVNQELLSKARGILSNRRRMYWIIGGACAGKSTLCQAISSEYGLPIYDMDAHIFGDYPNRYTAERHPAMQAWFTAPDSFTWLLGLPEDNFVAFNRAVTAEYLDLLADDLEETTLDKAILVDGGITNPALLAQVMPVGQIVCLEISTSMSAKTWEESTDRRFMQEMVFQLPNPQDAWKKFLHLDALIARILLEECKDNEIRIYMRDEGTPVEALVEQIASFLRIEKISGESATLQP